MIKKVAVTGAAPGKGIEFFASEVGVDSTLATAQYSATPTTLLPITSITITKQDATDVVIPIGAGGTDEKTVTSILRTALLAIGYDMSEPFGIDPLLPSVKISGETITIISELTFKSMVASSGSPTFTKKATRAGKCTFTKTAGTLAAPVINVNGTNRSVTAWTMGTTSAGTVKTNIETALAAEITAGTIISVAVTSDGVLYTITLTALSGTTILLQGSSFTQSNCLPYFK